MFEGSEERAFKEETKYERTDFIIYSNYILWIASCIIIQLLEHISRKGVSDLNHFFLSRFDIH